MFSYCSYCCLFFFLLFGSKFLSLRRSHLTLSFFSPVLVTCFICHNHHHSSNRLTIELNFVFHSISLTYILFGKQKLGYFFSQFYLSSSLFFLPNEADNWLQTKHLQLNKYSNGLDHLKIDWSLSLSLSIVNQNLVDDIFIFFFYALIKSYKSKWNDNLCLES